MAILRKYRLSDSKNATGFFGQDRRLFHDIDVDRLTDGTIAAFIRVAV